MGKREITVHIVAHFFPYQTKGRQAKYSRQSSLIKVCNDDLFPNIYALLKLCAAIPATSCEYIRSASSLRRLHTYNRACMSQEKLSSLALVMQIHYQVKNVLD